MTTHLCADFMVRFQHVPVPIRRTRLNAVGRRKAAFSTDKSMRRRKQSSTHYLVMILLSFARSLAPLTMSLAMNPCSMTKNMAVRRNQPICSQEVTRAISSPSRY